MIECFNNFWVILLCIFIFIIIIKKIYKLIFNNTEKYTVNNSDLVPSMLPTITSYYIGII